MQEKVAPDRPLLEQIKNLGPEARLSLARGSIKRFVEENPDGVTPRAIAEALNLSYSVVQRHLDYLMATRQLYVHEAGPRTVIYYPNARLSHPYARTIFQLGDETFRIHLIENQRGKFAYVQEMRASPRMGEQVAGGVIVRLEHLTEFISKLQEFVSKTGGEPHAPQVG